MTYGGLWRVGHAPDPLGFPPLELYEYNHRFDDRDRRFRTLYCAERAETCLREVLADFRPNLDAIRRHVERYGPEAAEDIVAAPVTAQWRRQNVLVKVSLNLDGAVVDLTDVRVRREIEDRHRDLLNAYDLDHLDLHEITTSRREVTQTIAGAEHDRGAGAMRFPSRVDGRACVAMFEGRGSVTRAGETLALTDPAPDPLTTVAEDLGLRLEPSANQTSPPPV